MAILTNNTKHCSKCKELKDLTLFNSYKLSNGTIKHRSDCKACRSINQKLRWKSKVRTEEDKLLASNKAKQWAIINKSKQQAYQQAYRSTERGKLKARESYNKFKSLGITKLQTKKAQRKLVDNLSDGYIKGLFRNRVNSLNYNEVTPELIDLKRKQLKLYRDVKKKTNTCS